MSSPLPFVPIRHRPTIAMSTGDPLADQILGAITVGSVRVGDRLPPEAQMAASFQVAIATLRKSLKALRDAGVVETRRGREGGTFVLGAPFPAPARVRAHLARLSIVDLRDHADEHATVAAGVAALAAERAPEHTVAELRALARGVPRSGPRDERTGVTEGPENGALVPPARVAVRPGPAELATADNRFYVALGAAAQSPRLLHALTRLCGEVSALAWSPAGAANTEKSAREERTAIVEAVAKRDPVRAARTASDVARGAVYRIIDAKLAQPPAQVDGRRGNDHG